MWRYTAIYNSGTQQSCNTYLARVRSDEEGVKGLEGFLAQSKKDYGHRLVAVTLESASDGTAHDDASATWKEVKRLVAGAQL